MFKEEKRILKYCLKGEYDLDIYWVNVKMNKMLDWMKMLYYMVCNTFLYIIQTLDPAIIKKISFF